MGRDILDLIQNHDGVDDAVELLEHTVAVAHQRMKKLHKGGHHHRRLPGFHQQYIVQIILVPVSFAFLPVFHLFGFQVMMLQQVAAGSAIEGFAVMEAHDFFERREVLVDNGGVGEAVYHPGGGRFHRVHQRAGKRQAAEGLADTGGGGDGVEVLAGVNGRMAGDCAEKFLPTDIDWGVWIEFLRLSAAQMLDVVEHIGEGFVEVAVVIGRVQPGGVLFVVIHQ